MKYNKPTILPITEDVTKLHKHLDKNPDAAAKALATLARAVLTKIVFILDTCPTRLRLKKLKNFVERECTKSNDVMGVSEYEQKLCHYFEQVELQGKRGRKDAVLLKSH